MQFRPQLCIAFRNLRFLKQTTFMKHGCLRTSLNGHQIIEYSLLLQCGCNKLRGNWQWKNECVLMQGKRRREEDKSASISYSRTGRCREWTKNVLCSIITLMHPTSNTIVSTFHCPGADRGLVNGKHTSFHKFIRLQAISSRR